LANRGRRPGRGGRSGGRSLQRSSPVADRRCKPFGDSVFRWWSDRCRGEAPRERLTSILLFARFLEILAHRIGTARWDLTWRKDVSVAGPRRGKANDRRAGACAEDHVGTSRAAMAGRHRGSRPSDPQSPCSGRGRTNSGIIRGRCAERRRHARARAVKNTAIASGLLARGAHHRCERSQRSRRDFRSARARGFLVRKPRRRGGRVPPARLSACRESGGGF
jgi:hypothetical protein